MTTPLEKGNALELAVKAIESAILEASPSLKESRFLIQGKKIVAVADVRHEVDIFVEVNLGKGYKAIFIFECKNWEEKVGKNEIIVFSEKVNALQAQKGFFVAKSFTSDAWAQSRKDPRLVLLRATEREATPVPFDFHIVVRGKTHVDLAFFEKGAADGSNKRRIDPDNAEIFLRGGRVNPQEYANDWAEELCNETLRTFPSETKTEGEYEFRASGERKYEEGQLKVGSMDCVRAEAHVMFSVSVVRPPVISDLEIETRGRVVSLAPVPVGDGHVQMRFITMPLDEG